jgi:RNA polymerase sigma-70 factor, ECF subfamily
MPHREKSIHNLEWEKSIKAGIKNGNSNTFRILYEKFYPALCLLARRYIISDDIAEEIVQETFMKIWESRRKLEIKGSLHAYLYTCVRNNSLNYLKHLLVERKYSADRLKQLQVALNYLQISQEDGSSLLIAGEMEKSLNDALESLPPKCREIFLLHRQEGKKHSEIAKELGISQNTVQRQISIALEKLRDKLLHLLS